MGSDAPIFPVVHTSNEGDRFSIDFPAKAPVAKEREAPGGGKQHPALDRSWALETMSCDGAEVDLAAKLTDDASVRMEVGEAEPPATTKFTLAVEIVNRLRLEVSAAPQPAAPQKQALKVLSPPMATRMAGPPEMMELEAAVSSLLESLTEWTAESDKLTLYATNGQMVFLRKAGSEDS